jgi:hypothetical protein
MNALVLIAAVMSGFQQPGDRPIPREETRLHVVRSTDGVNFSEVERSIATGCSSPDLIELATALPKGAGKGTVLAYVVDGDRTLARMESSDAGVTWTRPLKVKVGKANGDEVDRIFDPAVVQLEDGRLRLYFLSSSKGPESEKPPQPVDPRRPGGIPPIIEPRPNAPSVPPPPAPPGRSDRPTGPKPEPAGSIGRVLSAVSEDGLKFVLEEGERLDVEGMAAPEVVRAGDEWLMFWSRGQEILMARSRDGLDWRRERSFTLRGGRSPGAVDLGDGRQRIYQSGPDGVTSAVFDADRGTFRPDPGVRIPGKCGEPSVWALAGGGYLGIVKREAGDERPGR